MKQSSLPIKSLSMSTSKTLSQSNDHPNRLTRVLNKIGRNWLLIFNIGFAIFFGLPWLAPVFMLWGWENAARLIYLSYYPLCHQLPQRSYFLFGEQTMYTLDEIEQVWPDIKNLFELRKFTGNPQMGWKIAWSDRMVSMYGGILLGSLTFSMLRQKMKPISLWWFIIISIPMGVDGLTHTVSDLFGFKNGFRYHNLWLADLTQFAFEMDFYVGNGIGSFNWWMRLLSGLIFGFGLIRIVFPLFAAEPKSKANPEK
ncbi:MAG: putative membrane protein [Cellvibrionaceae bacterium]|jgi:uncharacterized membrane protein